MPRRYTALVTAVRLTATTVATAARGDGSPESGGPDGVRAGVIAIPDVAPIHLGTEKGSFSRRDIQKAGHTTK